MRTYASHLSNCRTGAVLALVASLCFIGFISGCGGGGGGSASPNPSVGSATVRAVYSTTGSQPEVIVTWAPGSSVESSRLLQYHVYRDGELIGATDYASPRFSDNVSIGGVMFPYTELVNENGQTSIPTRYKAATPLTFGVPHVYRIRMIYENTDDFIVDILVGYSNTITAPVQ